MEDLGIYGTCAAMGFGALMVALVLTKFTKHESLGRGGFALLFVGLLFLTISSWASLELSFFNVTVKPTRDMPPKQPSHDEVPSIQRAPASASESSRDYTAPHATDMSGSYQGTAQLELETPQGRVRQDDPVVLDINSEVGGNFRGFVSSAHYAGLVIPVEGHEKQGKFTATAKLPDQSMNISLEGKVTGKAIRGKYMVAIPGYDQYGAVLASPGIKLPSGGFILSRRASP